MESLYPVFFNYEEVVKGNRFLACVRARGRALMVHEHEDNEWVMYGVQPGSITECGETFEEARLLFRQAFREILYDLSEESPDFESFKERAERILNEINEPMLERWNRAADQLRADRSSVEEPLDNLPIVPARETTVEFEVLNLVPAKTSADNRADQYELAWAA
jgi:predicted RNase H-like HicB family nuclease